MNIHAQIVDGVIEARATGSVSTLDNLNHLIKNRSSQFGSNTDASFLGNMDSQQLLMILYCWVCDGYSGADLTREKILKEKKGGLSNKLWRSAISASTREEEEILRALEPGDNLAALQAAFDPNEDE